MDLETKTYSAPQLWSLVPTETKERPSLLTFKEMKTDGTVSIVLVGYAKLCQCWFCITCIIKNLSHYINYYNQHYYCMLLLNLM